ncbi:MAG: hypothetical protein UY96_C0028G0011 [Parcubacteria group bacterium GW2011_GWB1_56_8]|nr:MAG: hypothetical protein UY96_C0028G0011 [Parcubacteria group bacterium GW2011_GWB1_56_8]
MSSVDIQLEREVLSQSLRDTSFLSQSSRILQRYHFVDPLHRWIWTQLKDVWDSTREVLSGSVWRARLAKDFLADPVKLNGHQQRLLELVRMSIVSPHAALGEIARLAKLAELRNGGLAAYERATSGDVVEAEKALQRMSEATRQMHGDEEEEDWLADPAKPPSCAGSIERIPLPIPTLNKHIGGGVFAGHMGLILATTNIGKSAALVSFTYHALVHSTAVVLHLATEETKHELFSRYDARLSGFDRSRILSNDLEAHERSQLLARRASRASDWKGRLNVLSIGSDVDVGKVEAHVEAVRLKSPGRLLLLAMDTGDDLRPAKPTGSSWQDQGEVYKRLKNLTQEPRLAPLVVWVTTQAGREWEGKVPPARAVSKSYDKARKADLMVALSAGDSEASGMLGKGNTAIDATIVKSRLGHVKWFRVSLEANMGTSVFTEHASGGGSFTTDEEEEYA